MKEFSKILSSNSFNKNKINITAKKYTAKLFNNIQEIFYPNQLIAISTDCETFILIIKHFLDILKYVNKTNDLNIIWIPADNYFNVDSREYETLKSLKESKQFLQIYILNWIINIDKIMNKLKNLDDGEDEYNINCDYFCSKLLNVNELGKFLILKLEDFIGNETEKFNNLESYFLFSRKSQFHFKDQK